jgi:hypothetical protein
MHNGSVRRLWRGTMASLLGLVLIGGLLVSCPCEATTASSAGHSCCDPVTALQAADHGCCLAADSQAQALASAPEASPLPTPFLGAQRVMTPLATTWPARVAAIAVPTSSPPRVLRI